MARSPEPSQSKRAAVHDAILRDIRVGVYGPDQRMPSEDVLARDLGSSRATVREALTELEQSGLVVRRHGSGTYVAPRAAIVRARIDRLTTLYEVIQESGFKPEITGWSVEQTLPPLEISAALEIGRADRVHLVRRTYLAGRRHAAYCEGYVPRTFHGREIEIPRTPGELRWQLEQQLNVVVSHLVTSLEAVGATEVCAEALHLPVGTPLLLSRMLSISDEGIPLMLGLNYVDTTVVSQNLVQVLSASKGSAVV